MSKHREFLTQLENFDKESRNAARYAYADFAIQHAASKSKRLLNRLNETPTFWLAVSAAIQTATYISLGRIFDNNSPYNINQLLCSAELNISKFQREAVAKRAREGHKSDPPWLSEKLNGAYYPKQIDFLRLRKKVEKYRALYEHAFKPARNKYIAHREKQSRDEVSALFQRGTIKDLWRLTTFLQQLHDALWQLYHNGQKPKFRPMRYSVKTMFRKQANSSSAHEGIVRETKKLMEFLENCTPNNALLPTSALARRRGRA